MKVIITGISGFLAQSIIAFLERDTNISEILGVDLVEPTYISKKLIFKKRDVRDRTLEEDFKSYDAIIHLVFIVNPLKSYKEMYSINVDGSVNVFDCAIKAGVKKIIHASSVAAYGGFLDNPIPIKEDHPIRIMKKKFYYNETKVLVENYLIELEKKHSDISIVRIRPHLFFGPNINNFFQKFFKPNTLLGFAPNNPWQFTWVDDVAQGFYLALIKDFRGPLNLGADSPLSLKELSKRLNVRLITVPYKLLIALLLPLYKLRLLKKDYHGWIRVARYPIVIDSTRAKLELGWEPRYDVFNTIQAFLAHIKESKKKNS